MGNIERSVGLPLAEREPGQQPWALPIAALPTERLARTKFNTQFLGAIGLCETVESTPDSLENGATLADAIDGAVEGDPQSNRIVDINIATAVSEGVFKDRHVTRVVRQVNDQGEIEQHGLTATQMHYNSYVHRTNRPEQLRKHTLAEALNGYREAAAVGAGVLDFDGNVLVTFSGVAEGLDEDQLDHRGEGYFTRTMTYCAQGTTHEGEGKVVTESAFMAGTRASEHAAFAERVAQRFDIEAVGLVYEWLGLPVPKTVLEFLENPVLVSRTLMPNGIVDFVRWIDQARDILDGREAERPEEAYIQMRADSLEREASMETTRLLVKQELLGYAGSFKDPTEANALLWELVKKYTVEASVTNYHIDLRVFGAKAQVRLEKARHYAATGDYVAMERWITSAQRFAQVSGCGGGSSGREVRDMLDARRAEAGQEPGPWHGGKTHKNEECISCKQLKTEVGDCHICWECVQHPAIMEATYNREWAEKRRGKSFGVIIIDFAERAKTKQAASAASSPSAPLPAAA